MPPWSRHRSVALVLLTSVTLAAGACGGSSLPALSDPIEIITAGLTSTERARTVHLELTVDGSIGVDLTGRTGKATTVPVTGTTASADVDMAGGKAHATFAVPSLLNLTGEFIQIGETSYLKTSLTGPLFETQAAADALPVDPTDASGIFDGLGDLVLTPGVDPVKGEDVDCRGKSCYTVAIELTQAELTALGADALVPGDLPIDIGAASVALTIRVEKDTYHLAGIGAVVSLGDSGSLNVDLAMSNWDQPLDISAPSAEEVKPAP